MTRGGANACKPIPQRSARASSRPMCDFEGREHLVLAWTPVEVLTSAPETAFSSGAHLPPNREREESHELLRVPPQLSVPSLPRWTIAVPSGALFPSGIANFLIVRGRALRPWHEACPQAPALCSHPQPLALPDRTLRTPLQSPFCAEVSAPPRALELRPALQAQGLPICEGLDHGCLQKV